METLNTFQKNDHKISSKYERHFLKNFEIFWKEISENFQKIVEEFRRNIEGILETTSGTI